MRVLENHPILLWMPLVYGVESTARIQIDREQTVITTGPYRIVRHPGYFGIVIWAVAMVGIFGTF